MMAQQQYKWIDLTYLQSIGDTREAIAEILTLFVDQTGEVIQNMKNALQSNDWNELKIQVHSAKSVVNALGMNDLGNRMQTLETQIKSLQATETYSEQIQYFEYACQQALEEVNHFLSAA